MELTMLAAENAGFMKRDGDGNWIATGERGVLGYLEWVAVNRPERLIAIMVRGIPRQVNAVVTQRRAKTVEEIDAELRERGLPVELLEHLRKVPDVLQEGEDPDPYHMRDVTPEQALDEALKEAPDDTEK
jgi:hypothetical protein